MHRCQCEHVCFVCLYLSALSSICPVEKTDRMDNWLSFMISMISKVKIFKSTTSNVRENINSLVVSNFQRFQSVLKLLGCIFLTCLSGLYHQCAKRHCLCTAYAQLSLQYSREFTGHSENSGIDWEQCYHWWIFCIHSIWLVRISSSHPLTLHHCCSMLILICCNYIS